MFDVPAGPLVRRHLRRALAMLAIFALSGCESRSEACETDLDCFTGERCIVQTCLPQDERDAGDTDPLDTGDADDSDTSDAGDADRLDASDTDTPDADPANEPLRPIQVSAGLDHTCALLSDHTVWCWGTNLEGVLGQPESTPRVLSPIKIQGLDGARQVVAGATQTCARFEDGSVKCMGDSRGVGLGDGTLESSGQPVDVLIDDVHHLTASFHTCAIAGEERTLTCWGSNASGQTGSEHDPTLTPEPVAGMDGIAVVATGGSHTCALTHQDQVFCLGSNAFSQRALGPETEYSADPNEIDHFFGLNPVVELVSGGTHTCALEADGTLSCWGNNALGTLGRSTESVETSAEPLEVNTSETLHGLAAGDSGTCGITEHGDALCWGSNLFGELGVGDTVPRTGPVRVTNLRDVTSLSVGFAHSCAITNNDAIYCWGTNESGQLGIGSRANTLAPELPVIATWEE